MFFDFNYQSGLLFLFFFHGLVFASLLIRKGILEQSPPSKWLGLLIILCVLYISTWMLGHAGWYTHKPLREFLLFVPLYHYYIIGPVIYFYVRSLLDKSYKFTRRNYYHFIPGLIYILFSIIMLITDKFILEEYYFYADGRDRDLDSWYQISGLIYVMVYVTLSIRFYLNYKQRIYNELSFADAVNFTWINKFLISFMTIIFVRILFFIIYPDWGSFSEKWWYYLIFSLLFYYISIAGFVNKIRSFVVMSEQKENIELNKKDPYDLNDMDIKTREDWKNKISSLIDSEKLFINPLLTLSDIARELNTNPRLISRVINLSYTINFNDYINSFRVKTVIKHLEEKKHLDQTLLSIALDSGFNSKSTFNRAFNKATGLTPKSYISQLSK